MSVSSPMIEGSGHGERLRGAREAAGLDVATVAQRLKMPIHVVESLEADDWSRLGAPVFVRGQLRSYARLMRLPTEPFEQSVGSVQLPPTALVPRTRTPRLQRIADQVGGRLVYIVVTALIVLPIWVATQTHIVDVEPAIALDGEAAAPSAKTGAAPAASSARRTSPSTVVASMASLPQRQAAPAPMLSLQFNGDSWVRILAADGSTLEQALLKQGDVRNYAAGEVGRLTLGNASAVEVRAAGAVQDLTPYERSNVARFTVSSDGALQPTGN